MPLWIDQERLNNPQRLQALRSLGLLDTASHEDFDRITRLALTALDVPVSLISLVEPQREYVLSGQGLPERPRPQVVASDSELDFLGKYSLSDGNVTTIGDIRDHDELAMTPAVKALNIAAYLSAPLRNPEGHILGSVCVIDHRPRTWTAGEIATISQLAGMANRELRELQSRRIPGSDAWRSAASILEYLNDAVVVSGPDGTVIEWNRAAERLFGYRRDEILGRRMEDLLAEEARNVLPATIHESLKASGRWTGIVPIVRKDGLPASLETATVALHDETVDRLGYVYIHRDAADRDRVDDAVFQAQKMESLGALAGGVAHDFNNLLTAILGSVSMLRLTPGPTPGDVENLDIIEEAAHTAADITANLLNFARGEHSRLVEVDLRAELATAMHLAQFKLPKTVEVVYRLPEAPVLVEGDAAQIQQVVLNIVINACYVMDSGGTLTITLEAGEIDAILSIADTGPGMDKATCDRIFEPFFTTKPRGAGTGLGLASAHGIVVGHRGTIDVVSAPGEGTVFTVRLPLLGPAHAPVEPAVPPARSGAILVVDDDKAVRSIAVAMLRHIGFVADEAPTGEAAVRMVRETPERWAGVLLDLVMPQKSGSETFQELMAVKPDLCVIVASGYAPDRFLQDDERREIDAFLDKPFTLGRLKSTLAEIGLVPADRSAG